MAPVRNLLELPRQGMDFGRTLRPGPEAADLSNLRGKRTSIPVKNCRQEQYRSAVKIITSRDARRPRASNFQPAAPNRAAACFISMSAGSCRETSLLVEKVARPELGRQTRDYTRRPVGLAKAQHLALGKALQECADAKR
jgi:hypothetical protein